MARKVLGRVDVKHADARKMGFLDDDSVDLILTSPPYWGLRSYRDAGEHYDGQVGSEDTPQRFVDELVGMVDSEWRRVLKPEGSLWLNLGDKYASGGRSSYDSDDKNVGRGGRRLLDDARPKSLLGLPWRIALALIDKGWILRAEVIWSKPNGLPESVTDRVRRSHEQWFHFVLSPQYFSAVDEIREPHAEPERANRTDRFGMNPHRDDGDGAQLAGTYSPLGRLPGSVWKIPTDPLLIPDAVRESLGLVDHFAAFPQEWPRRIIMGWSPSAICVVCGAGRRPVTLRKFTGEPNAAEAVKQRQRGVMSGGVDQVTLGRTDSITRTIERYECECPEPGDARPAIVLDPFGGTGTTAGVARMLGRHGISVDLSEDYCRLARWRIFDSGHFSKTEDRTWADRQTSLI